MHNMKVLLYMAVSLDWYICSVNDDTTFVSDTEWDKYIKKAKEVWVIIIWSRTYEVMKEYNEFENLDWVRTFVFTKKSYNESNKNISFLNKSPEQALAYIKNEWYWSILLAWWSKLIASFLNENLVSEIFVDIEPHLLWEWKKLFPESSENHRLELIWSERFDDDWIQLHYKILK